MGRIEKLVRILQSLHETKMKIEALVLNLNDIANNDISKLQSEVQKELNKLIDFDKDCG